MGSAFYEGGKGVLRAVHALGTGAVSTQTKIVGSIPKNAKVTDITYKGQATVTGTSLVAESFARTAAGATGNSLQASTADVEFGSAAAAKTGVEATLTATQANRRLNAGQLIETTYTASSVTAGPGDVEVCVYYEVRA